MSIPTPEPGLVISYSYLWHREQRAGADEGRKYRPCVIVLAIEREKDGSFSTIVLPVTHSLPKNADTAIEIPEVVKKHLGLDESRSWIVFDEGNEFIWPGYDLKKISGTARYDYGFLPPRFFRLVRDAFIQNVRDREALLVSRD